MATLGDMDFSSENPDNNKAREEIHQMNLYACYRVRKHEID